MIASALFDTDIPDLKLDNILMSFEDDSIPQDKVQELQHSEHLFKETSHRRVFQSCGDFGPLKSYLSAPMIADFGSAEHADDGAYPIQPDAYRAPEVLLGWGWSSSADIWNLGNLVCFIECFCFGIRDSS